jgi:hypothetical protein
MRASRLPFVTESYWAQNVVYGVGLGTSSLIFGVARGIGGVVYEPILGCINKGFLGGIQGFARGLSGLV